MWLKEQIQIMIAPRKINCLNYSFKGKYFLRFSILHESQSGTKRYAYPKILKSNQVKDRTSLTNKRASSYINTNSVNSQLRDDKFEQMNKSELFINNNFYYPRQSNNHQVKVEIEKGRGYFQTQIFHVFYQYSEIEIQRSAIFRIQSKSKGINSSNDNNRLLMSSVDMQNNKICLKIQLFSQKSLLVQTNKDIMEHSKLTKKILEQQIMINLRNANRFNQKGGLDEFHKVYISDQDYFTEIDIYIGCVRLGWKFRTNKISLCQFISIPRSDQIQIAQQNKKVAANLPQMVGHKIKNLVKLPDDQILVDFYKQTVLLAKKQCLRLIDKLKSMGIYVDINYKWIHLIRQLSSENEIIDYYEQQCKNKILFMMLRESYQIYQNTRVLWTKYCYKIESMDIIVFIRQCTDAYELQQNTLQKISINIYGKYEVNRSANIKIFKKQRKKFIQQSIIYSPIVGKHPFFTLSNYSQKNNKKIAIQNQYFSLIGPHSLVILVHGYQGSEYDLRKIGNYLEHINTDVQIIYIRSIARTEDMDIQEMGKSVAKEIKQELRLSHYHTINFIGYSMGGLIIRAALGYLNQYKQKMNLFISLSCPHLGIFNSSNRLIQLGAWYISCIEKDKAIEDIFIGDNQDSCQKTILKKLSQDASIGWFQKVVLVTSMQDQFVPYYSSSISKKVENKQTKILADNIHKRVKRIQQMQIWFDAQERASTLDKLTGRQSHIEFIENSGFMHTLFNLYGKQL